jgi:hypothetical protein
VNLSGYLSSFFSSFSCLCLFSRKIDLVFHCFLWKFNLVLNESVLDISVRSVSLDVKLGKTHLKRALVRD